MWLAYCRIQGFEAQRDKADSTSSGKEVFYSRPTVQHPLGSWFARREGGLCDSRNSQANDHGDKTYPDLSGK